MQRALVAVDVGQGKLGGSGSSAKLTRGSIDASGFAVELGDTCNACRLSIDGSTLTESGAGPLIQVAKAAQQTQLSLSQVQLSGGMLVLDPQASLTIDGSTLLGSGDAPGLDFGGLKLDATGSTFKADDSPLISGYTSIGLYYATGDLDLGTATEAGNNTFTRSKPASTY